MKKKNDYKFAIYKKKNDYKCAIYKKKMLTSLQFTILVKHKYKYIHFLKFLDYDQNSCLNYGFGSAVDLTPSGT